MEQEVGNTSRAGPRWLLAVVAAFVVVLLALGPALHPIAIAGGEYDYYARRAELLLAGQLANDPFHGWLYPLLLAAAAAVGADAFAAGRVVSTLAAGALVYALQRATAARAGSSAAAWTTLLLCANAPFALLALQVASDMTAAALLALALWWLTPRASSRRIAAAGVAAGLAAAARPGLWPLLVVLVVLAATSAPTPGAGARVRGARVAAFAGAAVLGLLPHLVPTALQFGSPLANENWRILASKLAGWDTAPLHAPGYAGPWDLLAQRGGELFRLGLADLWRLWSHELGSWLAGRSPVPGVAPALGAAALAGLVHAARPRVPRELAVPAVVLGYTALVAFAFAPNERALLPIAPWALAATVALLLAARSGPARVVGHAACAALLLVTLLAAPACWRAFAASHANGDVAAAAQLRAAHGPSVVVATLYPLLDRHAPVRAHAVAATAAASGDAAGVWREVAAARDVDFLIASPATFAGPLDGLAAAAPAGAASERCADGALVVALPRPAPAWLLDARADATADGAGIALAVRAAPRDDVVAVGVTVLPPAGEPALLALARGDDGVHRGVWPLPAGAAGAWRFVPTCLLRDGQVHRAAAIVWPPR